MYSFLCPQIYEHWKCAKLLRLCVEAVGAVGIQDIYYGKLCRQKEEQKIAHSKVLLEQ
jgi:hypothetical protein